MDMNKNVPVNNPSKQKNNEPKCKSVKPTPNPFLGFVRDVGRKIGGLEAIVAKYVNPWATAGEAKKKEQPPKTKEEIRKSQAFCGGSFSTVSTDAICGPPKKPAACSRPKKAKRSSCGKPKKKARKKSGASCGKKRKAKKRPKSKECGMKKKPKKKANKCAI